MAKIVKKVIINCSLKDARDFILDLHHLMLLPGVKEVTKSRKEEDTFLMKGSENLPLLGLESASYKLVIDEKKADLVSYHLDGYAYEVKGNWRLHEVDGVPEVIYTMEYDIPVPIIGRLVDKIFVEKSFAGKIDVYVSSLKSFLVKVEDVMTKDVISVSENAPISEVIEKMEKEGIRYMPVVKERKLVGVATDGDILSRMYAKGWTVGEGPISEIMTKDVKTIEPEVPLFRAFQVLSSCSVRRLPVVKTSGELVGILSITDLEDHLGLFKKSKRRPSLVWGEVSD
ncbi:MAG: CBS domain-containing protein [Candidatus Subteraquimicrobiales bacterium]|nr:CBS domain-containing protein [Candidatus Subteraquimicrobiales bacterium]